MQHPALLTRGRNPPVLAPDHQEPCLSHQLHSERTRTGNPFHFMVYQQANTWLSYTPSKYI